MEIQEEPERWKLSLAVAAVAATADAKFVGRQEG